MSTKGYTTCARCRRPVDGITWWQDQATGDVCSVIECHGDMEHYRLRRATKVLLGPGLRAVPAVAFETPAGLALPAP